ncbi:hypothetical protein B566_EDAN016411 [Ephemera danica]|nr:hypothetical protein B566_EDAN016411 [Ephemera danica]
MNFLPLCSQSNEPGPIPDVHNATTNPRDCNNISTGAILLADILPSLFVKLIAPFLPFWVQKKDVEEARLQVWLGEESGDVRIATCVIFACAGFILVGASETAWLAIVGVIATSFASGLGEVTFLPYSSVFHSNVVSTWASGTGGAGVLGSFSYAGLTTLGVSPAASMYIMLVVPVLMAVTFWGILKHPLPVLKNLFGSPRPLGVQRGSIQSESPTIVEDKTLMTKLIYILPLLKYMIPLGLVYFFEYFINQGLFELIYFNGIWLDHAEQYRWLQVDYQIGVFISRSSVNLIKIKPLWLLAVLQGLNVILFTTEVIIYFVPVFWIILIAVLWEGLLGGAAYVNTFYQITKTIPEDRLEFSLGITTLSDAVGIALAGFLSIPAHNFICGLPLPERSD